MIYAYIVLSILSFFSAIVLFNDSFTQKSLLEIYKKYGCYIFIKFFSYLFTQLKNAAGSLQNIKLFQKLNFNFLPKNKKNIQTNDINNLSDKNARLMKLELAKYNLLDENGNIRKDLTPEERKKLNQITQKYINKQKSEDEGSIFYLKTKQNEEQKLKEN